MAVLFIRAEDGSYIYIPNITRLAIETDYNDKTRIKAHHSGPAAMPFLLSTHATRREAEVWLDDLVVYIEADGGTESSTGRVEFRRGNGR